MGHSNTITCCDISSNGYSLCTSSMDRTALIWDLRMSKRLLKLSGHINVVSSCAFSPNNHYLCTTSWDKTIRVYDVHAGTYRNKGEIVLEGHEGSINSCCFNSDGSMLISCGCDQYVMLWSMINFDLIGALKGTSSWFQNICVSQDDKMAVTCSKNGLIKFWNIEAANMFYKKQNTGLNVTKCSQCGCAFSTASDLYCLPKQQCVFCRLASPQRSIESLVATVIQ